MSAPPLTDLLLCARVPAYGAPAWLGERRHPESTDDFGSVNNLQHIAGTLSAGGFELLLVDPPPSAENRPGTLDAGLCALVLALAAPSLRVGLSHTPPRRAFLADPSRLLGAQWAGIAPVPITCSVRVLVAATRWMAEDQFAYMQQHFPGPSPLRAAAGHGVTLETPTRETSTRETLTEVDPPILVGTPAEVADELQARLQALCDSQETPDSPTQVRPVLELLPIHIPGSYEAFVRMVVPQLRRRGMIGEHASPWRPTI
jgi:hypothetical protein